MRSLPSDICIDANLTRIVGRFNNALRLRKLDEELLKALAEVPSCGSNDSIFSAKALSLEATSILNAIFIRETDLRRVEPVVAVYKELVAIEEQFRLLNFFGSDQSAKHKAPNKILHQSEYA